MEALRVRHTRNGGKTGLPTRADPPVECAASNSTFRLIDAGGALDSDELVSAGLPQVIAAVNAVAVAAPDMLALADYGEAADFAGLAEDLSRTVEYMQILAAGAVDRTRALAISTAGTARSGSGRMWVTGRDNGAETLSETNASWPASPAAPFILAAAGFTAPAFSSVASVSTSPADDGYRNAAEFLRDRLRISAAEGHRRIRLAAEVLPRTGITGHTQPAERPELAAALAAGIIASRPATIITTALHRVRHHASEDTTARMEHALTRAAAENDTDFLTRIARRWIDAIDQDGTEPTEHELHHRQGAFLRRPRRGLHHVEIFASPDQYEHLLTVMNTATNPRARAGNTGNTVAGIDARSTASGGGANCETGGAPDVDLDGRTRPQQLLDGLVGACKAALAAGALPAAGGLRPQVLVTIDYRDLLDRLEHATTQGPRYRSRAADSWPGSGTATSTGTGTGSFTFTGPVTASTVRRLACDADIIPVLLGSEGRILDLGRATRIFPPHIRKAITARDQGCAFPACTIPAPWCEAHHITYWSHGGSTSTDNGTLLCTHHHHLVHKEQWKIQVKTGVPWFIPPPHIDPRQRPRRNHRQT